MTRDAVLSETALVDDRGDPVTGLGSGPGGGAPTDARYVVTQLTGGLSDELLIGSIILAPDTLANRPSASGLVAGTLYFPTDNATGYRADGAGNWADLLLGGGGASFPLTSTGAATTTDAMLLSVTAEATPRFVVNYNGALEWGNGTLAVDTILYRGGGNQLRTDSQFLANSAAVGNVPLIARGFAGQTGNLMQFQDSAQVSLAFVSAAGQWVGKPTNGTDPIISGRRTADSASRWWLTADGEYRFDSAVAVNGLVIRPSATPTNLMQWVDSAGTVLSSVDPIGSFNAPNSNSGTPGYGFENNSNMGMYRVGSGILGFAIAGSELVRLGTTTQNLLLTVSHPDRVGITVKAAAAQTANVEEWQNSAGTPVANVTAGGAINSVSGGLTFSGGADLSGILVVSGYPSLNLGTRARLRGTPGGLIAVAVNAADCPIGVLGAASQAGNLQAWMDSTSAVLFQIDPNGFLKWVTGKQQTTVGAAGGASALPATPTRYLQVKQADGTTLVIPAYAAA